MISTRYQHNQCFPIKRHCNIHETRAFRAQTEIGRYEELCQTVFGEKGYRMRYRNLMGMRSKVIYTDGSKHKCGVGATTCMGEKVK